MSKGSMECCRDPNLTIFIGGGDFGGKNNQYFESWLRNLFKDLPFRHVYKIESKRFGHLHFATREEAGQFYHYTKGKVYTGPDGLLVKFSAALLHDGVTRVQYVLTPSFQPTISRYCNNINDNNSGITNTNNNDINTNNNDINTNNNDIRTVNGNNELCNIYEDSEHYYIIFFIPTITNSNEIKVKCCPTDKKITIIGSLTSFPLINDASPIFQYFKSNSDFQITVRLAEKIDRRKKIKINIIEKGIGKITIDKKIKEEKKEIFLEILEIEHNEI